VDWCECGLVRMWIRLCLHLMNVALVEHGQGGVIVGVGKVGAGLDVN
jgi:hypothetical protein